MRIISLSPATTKAIIDMGLENNLIAITEQCKNIFSLDKQTIGDMLKPNINKISHLNPDIILSSMYAPLEIKKEFSEKLLFFDISSINDIINMYKTLEKHLKSPKKLSKQLEKNIKELLNKKSKTSFRVYVEDYPSPTMVSGNWVNEIIKSLGHKTLLDKGESKQISDEQIKEFDPEIIIINWCFENKELLDKRTNSWPLNETTAHKKGNIFVIPPNTLTIPASNIIKGIEQIISIIEKVKNKNVANN